MAAVIVATTSVHGYAQPKEPITKERQLEICIASFEEAQLKQKRGKVVFARKLFTDCAMDVCPKPLRDDCAEHRDAIDKAVPTASFVVRDASGKDVEATFKVDGQPFPMVGGRATPIDPGEHDVEYQIAKSAGGDLPAARKAKIRVQEGEKSRVIVLSADDPAGAPASTTTPPPQVAGSGGLPVGPILVGTLGVLILGVGIVEGVVVAKNEASERDSLRVQAAGTSSLAEQEALNKSADSHNKASKNNQLLGGLIAGGGLIVICAGVAWYFIARSNKPPAAAKMITPIASPTGAGAAFSLSF